jgi:hypothetical protein
MELVGLTQKQLDDIFRASDGVRVPTGDAEGTVLIFPGTKLERAGAVVGRLLAWQGKVFNRPGTRLVNKVTPLRVKAIRAKVYKAPSWFDQKEAVILDYSKTSFVAQMVRDEIREVSPGTYLGIVYLWKWKTINFALTFANSKPMETKTAESAAVGG